MENSRSTRAERFLRRYRVLEGLLEKRYGEPNQGSVVYEYIRSADAEEYRYELNLIREIRNLLTHNALEGGQPVVEPSDSVLRALEKVIAHVEQPQFALDYATSMDQILCASMEDSVDKVMRQMRKYGFSNVPVVEKGQTIGIFSTDTLFMFLEKNGLDALESDMRICDLGNVIDISHAEQDSYRFMPQTATVTEARAAFRRYRRRNNRLRAIFITPNGKAGEKLLALLTPWDVMKDNPQDERGRVRGNDPADSERSK